MLGCIVIVYCTFDRICRPTFFSIYAFLSACACVLGGRALCVCVYVSFSLSLSVSASLSVCLSLYVNVCVCLRFFDTTHKFKIKIYTAKSSCLLLYTVG